jgi:hypothetical protein
MVAKESSTERLGVVGAELLPATEEAKLLNWGLAVSPLFFFCLCLLADSGFFLSGQDPGFAPQQILSSLDL